MTNEELIKKIHDNDHNVSQLTYPADLVDNTSIQKLADALKKNTVLRDFIFDTAPNLTEEALRILIQSLNYTHIQKLFIKSELFMNTVFFEILFFELRGNTRLIEITLHGNGSLTKLEAENLAHFIANHQHLQILTIDFYRFTEDSLNKMSSALYENKGLKKFTLSHCVVPKIIMESIADSCCLNENLEHLSFANTQLRSGYGNILAQIILLSEHLKSLDLSGCSISNQDKKIILNALARNSTLKNLDLSSNISTEDCMQNLDQFCNALGSNTSKLDTLNLMYADFNSDLLNGLFCALNTNSVLTSLKIQTVNSLNIQTANLISNALESNKSLKELYLDSQIESAAYLPIFSALAHANQTLQTIAFSGKNIDATAQVALETVLKINIGLVALFINEALLSYLKLLLRTVEDHQKLSTVQLQYYLMSTEKTSLQEVLNSHTSKKFQITYAYKTHTLFGRDHSLPPGQIGIRVSLTAL